MTLVQQCGAVNGSLEKLEHARQQQTLADSLNKRTGELDEFVPPLESAMSATTTLLDAAIIAESRLPRGGKVAERVASMRRQLETTPQDITKGQTFNQLCRALKKLTEDCDRLASAAWQEYVMHSAPVVHKTTLNQFRESPGHSDIVYQIEQLQADLRSLVRKPPATTETLNDISSKWKKLSDAISRLPVSDDPEVQAFLNAATSSEGAQIELLTQAVIEWLKDKSMLSDFRIRRSK